ncbi:MAG: tetratricopeptide repeat protein [Muribaculaceae bacterium]|nr:tetratricopeptide repeat protein [Muribaculaceae bacterium]MDE6553705.1 tetratricopeptide repeat protein [Muribaculaceae bacterium]
MMKFRTFFAASLAAIAVSASAQTHLEGAEYYKADQLDNAKELLLRNLNNAGTDKAIANYYLGLIAIDENKLDEAQKYFEAGVQANPNYGYNYIGLGGLALKRGDKKAAEDQFKKGESLIKKDAGAEIAIARAYYDADPVLYAKEIEKKVAKARKINLQAPEIYIFEGDQEKDKKNWGGAAGKYEMAKNYNANATEAYVKYANLYTQVNPQFAVTMLKELLSVNPTSALGQRELANAYYNKKDFADAAREYGVYVKNPNHFKQDEDRYALLLFSSQDFDNGYKYASQLLSENPGNFTARRFQFMNAANLPNMADQLVPMAEELLAARNANPQANKFAPIDYVLIAEEFTKAKRAEEAIAVLNEAIKEMPDNANFNKQLAMAYLESNNMAGASDAYEGYLAKLENPDFNDYSQQATFSFYAGVENKQNNPAKAEEYFNKAYAYATKMEAALPGNYKPYKIYGDIAMQRAASDDEAKTVAFPQYSEAAVLIEKSENPSRYARDAKTIYNYLGNYYLDQKDVAKAKENFNKYLQYDPDNESYRKFVEGLK